MDIVACDQPSGWDRYIVKHPQGGPFHLFGWKNIFQEVYHLPTFYLMAIEKPDAQRPTVSSQSVVKGILAMALIDSGPKRKRLVSLPYVDVAGVLTDDKRCEARLLEEAIRIANSQTGAMDRAAAEHTAEM